jgi:hypothetical protein|eukprot:SAG25_NODE_1135_length_3824_cov_5.545756_2_plen_72_part_00
MALSSLSSFPRVCTETFTVSVLCAALHPEMLDEQLRIAREEQLREAELEEGVDLHGHAEKNSDTEAAHMRP